MQKRWGFTVVELVVVMVVMVILLTIAGLSLGSSQARARDTERTADTEAIARGLEARYTQGKISTDVTTAPAYVTAGAYPGTDEMTHIMGTSVTGFTPAQIVDGYGPVALPGTTIDSFSPPTVASGSYGGFVLSTCTTVEDTTCLSTLATANTYVYEPITASNTLCAQAGCVRYNLYWKYEANSPSTLQKIRSKHQ